MPNVLGGSRRWPLRPALGTAPVVTGIVHVLCPGGRAQIIAVALGRFVPISTMVVAAMMADMVNLFDHIIGVAFLLLAAFVLRKSTKPGAGDRDGKRFLRVPLEFSVPSQRMWCRQSW